MTKLSDFNIDRFYSFDEYVNNCFGNEKNKPHLETMQHVLKYIELDKKLYNHILNLAPMHWVLIAEPWCGDTANILPILYAIAVAGDIPFSIVLRDKNELFIDAFLTNGGRSIPKLIACTEGGVVLSSWGPRPAVLSKKVEDWKHAGVVAPELHEKIVHWYKEDNTKTTQEDILDWLRNSF